MPEDPQQPLWHLPLRKLIEGLLEMGLALVLGVPGALLMLIPDIRGIGVLLVVAAISTGIYGFFLAREQVKR